MKNVFQLSIKKESYLKSYMHAICDLTASVKLQYVLYALAFS